MPWPLQAHGFLPDWQFIGRTETCKAFGCVLPVLTWVLFAAWVSPREREVLQLVVRGFHNREIADMLNIGENGVKKHLKGIFAKLDVATRTEAASAAIERGIVRVGNGD